MDTIIQSQVFFFISSVGFIILGILIAIILIFVLGAVRSFNNILKKISTLYRTFNLLQTPTLLLLARPSFEPFRPLVPQ